MRRPALKILIPLTAGIMLSSLFNAPVLITASAACISIAASVLLSRKDQASSAALSFAILFSAMALMTNAVTIPGDDISHLASPEGRDSICVSGVVADDPVDILTRFGKIRTSFTLRASSAVIGGARRNVSGLAAADIFSDGPAKLAFGDSVELKGSISGPAGLNNPGLFNYAGYLKTRNIYSRITVSSPEDMAVSAASRNGFVKNFAYKMRRRFRIAVDDYLQPPYSGFLKAILIGDRNSLDAKINGDFVKTGTVHVLAVSGLNVAMIAALVLALFALIGLPRKISLSFTAVFLVFYSIAAGSNPPIVRAAIMFAICAAGAVIERDSDMLNSLSIAAIAILLFNPKELFDPSFQLSFASIAGIIVFMPGVKAIISRGREEEPGAGILERARRYLVDGVCVSIAAWIATGPIVVSYFNIVSPVSVIANLVAIPALFALTAGGFLLIALGPVWPTAASVTASALQLTERALFAVNSFLAGLPFAYFRAPKPGPVFMALYYLTIYILLVPNGLRQGKCRLSFARAIIILLAAFNLMVWRGVIFDGANDLKATFLDVGQGDSAFIEFPGGGNMLVDGGPGGDDVRSDAARSVVAPFLWNKGVGVIDLLVATHLHDDHLGGLIYILDNFKVGCVADSGARPEENDKLYREYLRLIKAKKVRRIELREGDLIRAFPGVEIFILNPPAGEDISDSNDNSVVLKILCRKFAILMCADIKDRAVSRINSYGGYLRADVIKVPHHGGDLGSRETVRSFFGYVKPDISIISVGAFNKYGMPNDDTIDIINVLQSRIYPTSDVGAVDISYDPVSHKVITKTTLQS